MPQNLSIRERPIKVVVHVLRTLLLERSQVTNYDVPSLVLQLQKMTYMGFVLNPSKWIRFFCYDCRRTYCEVSRLTNPSTENAENRSQVGLEYMSVCVQLAERSDVRALQTSQKDGCLHMSTCNAKSDPSFKSGTSLSEKTRQIFHLFVTRKGDLHSSTSC